MQHLKIKKITRIILLFLILTFSLSAQPVLAQEELEYSLDIASATVATPKIFSPNIDLSGRGYHRKAGWPQGLASAKVLETWGNDIGFRGIYRLQYNLWEIDQLNKDKEQHQNLLNNYESVIKKVSDAGGTVILNIFSTPPGLGRVLDKKSSPRDLKSFKALVKGHMRNLSCNKKYNIWYEVWSAPDLDDFFLGRRQEYLNIYRVIAEAALELEVEAKIHIPVGGPSTSWWFQDADGNNILTPERSLVYDLIRYCFRHRLPLDFISWHSYTTDAQADREATIYQKGSIELIREWLTYFHFPRGLPLLVSEWNYDSSANILPERAQSSHISSSYIFSRLKNMYEAGIDYQTYFCLEDFDNNKEKVVRNVGIFWFDPESSDYKGAAKTSYLAFRMLALLGGELFSAGPKINDDYINVIAAKSKDQINILAYNYIDPYAVTSLISRTIATFSKREQEIILGLVRSGRLDKLLRKESDINSLRTTPKVKGFLNQLQELNERIAKLKTTGRTLKLNLKGLKGTYVYQKYLIDASIRHANRFLPVEEKEISVLDTYQESLTMSPYSAVEIVLQKKSEETARPEQIHSLPAVLLQETNLTASSKSEANVTVSDILTIAKPEPETSAGKN